MQLGYFLKAVTRLPQGKKNEVYLTFDDGPHPVFTLEILKVLKKHNAKATFFCIGKNIEKYPELFKKIRMEGHLTGNHSFKHSNANGFLSSDAIYKDLKKTQDLLLKLSKQHNVLFRPPFGVTNPNIAKAVKKHRLITVGWSIRSYDTVAKSPQKVFEKINKKIIAGDIVLLHDTSNLTVTVLEQLLISLESKQLKPVTLNTLIK